MQTSHIYIYKKYNMIAILEFKAHVENQSENNNFTILASTFVKFHTQDAIAFHNIWDASFYMRMRMNGRLLTGSIHASEYNKFQRSFS